MRPSEPKNEKEFLQSYDSRQFSGPICSVDMAIFSVIQDHLHVLLIKRDIFPSKGDWALPGGIVDIDTDDCLESTALRKLQGRTGVRPPYLEQVGTVGNRFRDPRHWSISVVYFALMNVREVELKAGEGASEVRWCGVDEVGKETSLAFDHEKLLSMAVDRLRSKVRYTMLPAFLLPEEFTLKELVDAYRAILGDVEQAMIRKRALREGLVEETGNLRHGSNRPAKLYRVAAATKDHVFERIIGS